MIDFVLPLIVHSTYVYVIIENYFHPTFPPILSPPWKERHLTDTEPGTGTPQRGKRSTCVRTIIPPKAPYTFVWVSFE